MMKFFDKIEKFLEAAEAGAKNASKKGVETLRALADWLEATSVTIFGAKKPSKKAAAEPDEAKVEELCGRLEAVGQTANTPKGKMPATGKAPPAEMGPGVAILVQVLLAALKTWLENRKKAAEETPDEEETEE